VTVYSHGATKAVFVPAGRERVSWPAGWPVLQGRWVDRWSAPRGWGQLDARSAGRPLSSLRLSLTTSS
jgi:hypothetical protein